MSDEPQPQQTTATAQRGRKSETAAQRLERLQKAVAEAKIAARDAQRRQYAIVGEAVMAEAEADAHLKDRIREILRRRVTGQQARADIASLLRE